MTLSVVHFKSPAKCRCIWVREWLTELTVIGKLSGSVSNRNLWIPNRSECSSSSLRPSPATEQQMYFQSQARRRMINSGSRGNRSAIGSNSFAKSSSERSKLTVPKRDNGYGHRAGTIDLQAEKARASPASRASLCRLFGGNVVRVSFWFQRVDIVIGPV